MKIKIGKSYVDSNGRISYIKEKHSSIEGYFNSSGNETFDKDGNKLPHDVGSYSLIKEYFDPRLKECLIKLKKQNVDTIYEIARKNLKNELIKTLKEIGE